MTGQNKTFRGKRHDGTANPIDVYVGSRIQKLRIAKGWSQSKLASLLGITFQQIQKYEKGLNRISASRLWYTAQLMNVSVDYFSKTSARICGRKVLNCCRRHGKNWISSPDFRLIRTMSKPPSANPIRRFSNGGFLHSVPAGSFFRRFPATPKTLLLKETFHNCNSL